MAWSWSHTVEAYVNARNNLQGFSPESLRIIYAEWEGKDDDDRLDEPRYEKALEHAKSLPGDVLIDYIWDKMEEQANCTNGGHMAWCCPFGCLCHMVSFDDEGKETTSEEEK